MEYRLGAGRRAGVSAVDPQQYGFLGEGGCPGLVAEAGDDVALDMPDLEQRPARGLVVWVPASLSGSLVNVYARLVHPPILFGIIGQVQEQAKQFSACSLGEPESGCMRREAVCEGTRIVISQADRASDELSYSLGILVVSQQV